MKYTSFGKNTGLRISELALGTGNFGKRWGYGTEKDEAKIIFDTYANAGGNFIDTANSYQLGESEEFLSDFIAKDRDHFVLASKYSFPSSGTPNISHSGNSRKNMVFTVEESLKRLKTDHLDILWAHLDDGVTPLEEILKSFDDLVRSGKILYAGMSNFPAWKISRAVTIAELRGWSPITGIQIEHSLSERAPDRELLPMAAALGLGVAAWSPLAGGFLTGKYRETSEGRLKGFGGKLIHTENSEQQTQLLDTLITIAKELSVDPGEVAIAWLLHKSKTISLVPILGPRSNEQLLQNLKSLQVNLSQDQFERLTNISEIKLGSPYEIIKGSHALITSGKPELFR